MNTTSAADIPLVNFSDGVPIEPRNEKQILPHNMTTELQEYEIVTPNGIPLRVYHQASTSKSSIITYHDIGTNRKYAFEFQSF